MKGLTHEGLTWHTVLFGLLAGNVWAICLDRIVSGDGPSFAAYGVLNWYLVFSLVSVLISVAFLPVLRRIGWGSATFLGILLSLLCAMLIGGLWILQPLGVVFGGIAAVTFWPFTLVVGVTHGLLLKALDTWIVASDRKCAHHA